jgi:hypothetical protein
MKMAETRLRVLSPPKRAPYTAGGSLRRHLAGLHERDRPIVRERACLTRHVRQVRAVTPVSSRKVRLKRTAAEGEVEADDPATSTARLSVSANA